MKYRIISNGHQYMVQQKGLFWWKCREEFLVSTKFNSFEEAYFRLKEMIEFDKLQAKKKRVEKLPWKEVFFWEVK